MKICVFPRFTLLLALLYVSYPAIGQTTPSYQFQSTPLAIPTSALAFADFNGDGKQDAVGMDANGIVVYLGNSDGTFAITPIHTPVTGNPAYTFSNKLIVANAHNRNNVYPGVAFFVSQFNASGALEDYGVINGDGRGDGTFGLCDNAIICLPASQVYTVAPAPLMLVAGDFLNNGNTDIAFAAQLQDASTPGVYDNNFFVFTGNGYGDLYEVTLPQALLPEQVNSQTPNPSALPADFANNGYPYLLVNPGAVTSQGVTTLSGLSLGINNRNGTFTAGTTLLPGVSVTQFLPVDINADKNLDIVYTEAVASSSPSTSIKAILGDGAGNFGSPMTLVSAPSGLTGTLRFAFADLDHDGNMDLIFSGQSNGLYWASGNGNGTFNTPALITSSDTLSTYATYPVPPLLGASTTFAWGQKAAYSVETGPQLSISPASIDFGSQIIGSSSASQSVTLTNTGTQAVMLSSVSGSPEFTAKNGCASSLAPGANCSVQISFAPTSPSSQSGTLTLSDNAPNSPQTVTLTGNGTNVSVAAATSSSLSSTITSGGTATYVLSIGSVGGFAGNLTVSCTGAPSGYQCSPSPASVNLTGSPVSVTFTVSPTTAGMLNSDAHSPALGALLLSCLLVGFYPGKRRNCFAAGALFFLLIGACTGCGGGSGGANQTPPPVSNSYTLTAQFTTSAGQTISQPLTLTINSK